jgi:integrase
MKKPARKIKKRPLEVVVEKGQQIPIYHTPDTKGGKVYDSYTIVFIQAGKRIRRRATTIDAARDIAISVARQLGDGVGHVAALTPSQVADFASAQQILRQHPGATLATAIAEWAAANVALGSGGSIVAACEAQRKATLKRSGYTPALVSDVYEAFMASQERERASTRYIEDCTSRMGQIKDTFRGYIHAVEKSDIEAWLNKKKIGMRTRKNYRAAAVTFWAFAKAQGYLPRDQQTEAELLSRSKRTKAARLPAEIGVYEPAQLRKILEAAPDHLLPVFAIGAFAGLRSAELHRLKWSDIHPSYIEVSADDSKTAVKRHAPVPIALKEWLAGVKRGESDERLCARFAHEKGLARAMSKAVRDAGEKPVHNGLRHTFCSARVAATDDVKQTSREAGNSPAIILKHYVKVMTRAKGQAWFNVRPSTEEKIIPITAAA